MMNPPSPTESSLYQLTQSLSLSNPPLEVNLLTFKSVVAALLDLLIEQRISATVWVKLPTGNYWVKEIERYQQQGQAQHIYWCNIRQDAPPPPSPALRYSAFTPLTPIVLETSSHLKKEFFVIIVSEQLSCLILVQEQFNKPSESKSLIQGVVFNLVYSFDCNIVIDVLAHVKQWITITDTTPADLLMESESSFTLSSSPNSSILTHLLLKQIQQTEKLQSESDLVAEAQSTINHLTESINLKNQILTSLVHELRLPVTNMKTGLKLLGSMQSKKEQRQRYIDLLQKECDRQQTLLSGLQEFVQLDQSSATNVDTYIKLEDLIPGIVSTYQPLAEEKGILLGYTVPAGFPPVACPEVWLRQIILNLLSNSLKFTQPNGRVIVQARLKNDKIELTVSDTGIGIDGNDLPHIYDSFYRGRNALVENSGGAGLGLTIVQQLIKRCRGSISVRTQPGKGSVFTVVLPVFSEPE